MLNTVAGEECDGGGDEYGSGGTYGCDDDCTVPRCGDGHLNPNVEDCDDGDVVDSGNGCSATCLRNVGHCGDGVVQSGVEECEPDTGPDNQCQLSSFYYLED